MSRVKTFNPAPYTPGARITWTHFTTGGEVQRTGVVWSLAPTVKGGRTVWVTPDTRDEGDLYPAAVPVTVAPRRRVAGTWHAPRRGVDKGEAYSETDTATDTGALALVAWRGSAAYREANRRATTLAA